MENLYETITLCKAKRIDACMQTFDAALTDAETCGDMMMRAALAGLPKEVWQEADNAGTDQVVYPKRYAAAGRDRLYRENPSLCY